MSCVNITSKEFKDLCAQTGMSEGNVELAVHKFQNDLNTDKYPSIDYIQNYYTGTNTATGESQLELWNLNYDHDLVFNTEDLFKEAKEEALKYFESDAITTFEDKQGRKVLRVAPPTAAIEKGMQEILGSTPRDSEGNLLTSDDNIGEGSYSQSSETEIKGTLGDANLDNSRFDFGNRPKITLRKKFNWREHRGAEILATLSAKVQDKVTNNIESYLATRYSQGESHTFIMEDYVPNANATTTEVLDNIIKKSANKDLVELAKAVKKRLSKERGVYTTTRQSSRTGLRGQYTINNKIDLYPKATYGTTEAEARRLFESVILHEITHSITSDGLFANKQFREEVAEVMGQLNDYLVQNGIKSAKDLANTSDFYFFKNGKEFLSEFMSRPVLRETLKQMEYKGTGKVKKSLFKKVVDAILRFFGMRPSSTLFERTEQIFEDISKYQVDENYNRTADIEANEEGVTKGVLGVNKEQLISLLGSTMYQNNIQEIAIKELVQNAFDAVKIAKYQGKITDPKIDITIDGKTREIIVSDNGMGMTPEIVQKAFFTMGGSYKGENVDNRLKSGGLGMAKMAFLFSSEYIELKTVKDGIETTVNTNPEEIKKDNFYIKTKQTNAPNGTTVKVQIPEHYIDENGKERSIYFHHESSFLKNPLIGDVDITVRARPYYGESFIESKKEKIPKEYNKLGTAKSAFGDIEIYVTTDSNYKSRNAQILSSGLFQFNNNYLSWGEKPRMGVIINIKPSVDVRHSLYPFNNNRESFRGSVEEEIKDLNFLLLRIHRNVESLIYKRTFGSAISIDISDVSEVSADKIADEDILEEVKKSIEIFEDSSDSSDTEEKQYDLSNAVRKLRESTENQRRSTFDEGDIDIEDTNTKVDTSLLDINRPVFHNNTTMVLDKRAQDFCKDLGTHILTLKKLVQAAIKKGTFNTTGWISEKKLDTQYWGISIDTNYSGVNVHPRVFSFLSINPFSFSPAKGDKIAYYTSYIEHILFHEFNHNYINGENKNFTSNFPIVYSNMYGMGEAYIEWRKILEEIVKNNITTIEENYEKYLRSRNKAESFEGDSITRGDKSEDRSTESNRRVNENQRNEGVLSETTGALRGRAKEIEQSSQTESSFKEKEGSLKITPTRSVDIKAEAKGKISNKFIGYGVEGSSTLEYARQAGDKANTGVYNSDDTVFVSIGGKRGTLEKRKDAQNKTIDEALKAVRNGATLITDNKAYIERSDYNEGEKRLAEALKKEGAVYSETVVDGHTLGVWKRTTSQSTILTKNEDSGPIELSLFSDEDFKEPLSEGNEIEAYQIEFEYIGKKEKEKTGAGENVVQSKEKWTRNSVKNDTESLYIFTDNTDRSSGKTIISPDSWYSKKYGQGHCYPSQTSAIIRGLDNARPISTQRYYHIGAKGETGRWNDSDIEEFKKVIDAEINEIIKEWNTGKYKRVVFPGGAGLFYSPISQITKERTPELFKYLAFKYSMLKNVINSGYNVKENKNKNVTAISEVESTSIQAPETIDIWSSKNNGYERLSNFNNGPVTTDSNFSYQNIEGSFKTVEGAFQAQKLAYTNAYTKEEENDLIKQFEEADGQTARALGRSIKGLNRQEWDRDSEMTLENIMLSAFEENPDAKELLLSTGDAELTHVKGSYGYNEKFPKILMKIRRELQGNFGTLNPSSPNEKEETAAKKQKEEDEKFLQEQVKLASQLEALNNSSLLSSSELRDIIEQIVYSVSDHITEIMENPEKAKKIYGELVDKIDFDNVSRIEFINAIGASNILRYAMELFAPKPGKYDKISTIRKANLIIKNWGAVMIIANSVFDSVEGISFNKSGEAEVAEEVSVINVDDVNNNTDFDYIAEIEGNLQEHWQIESRTLDVLASMTALVRAELSKCYILTERGKDAEGNPIYDNEFSEFGIKKRVKTRDAVNSILRWIQGATDMPSTINKLKEKKDKNPWVSSLLEKLEDKSGKYSNFQSQFYSVFMKHHQVYSVVTKVNGKYTSKPINVDPAMSTVIDKIVAMYNIESHPLFTSSGINKTELGKLQEAHKELVSLLHKNKEALTEEQVNQVNSLLVYAANALGYSIDFNEALSTFNQETATKMMYSLGYIITILEKNKDNTGYNPFAFKGGIKGNLTAFLSSYVEKLEDIAPSCFYDSGKMYQNYVTPSYLTILMTKFKSEKDFQEFMQKEYGQYAWFRDQKNRDLSMGWKNSWLRELYNDPKAAKIFAHKVQLHFDKDSYMRGLSPEKYVLSVVQEYFSENAEENKTRVPAWFRVPIMSNKPSSEFIRFYSERGEFYKTTIIDGLKNIFNQELTRIQSVRASNYALSDQEYLQNYDKNGKRFQFLDWMNEYLDGSKKDTELGKLINKKIEGKKELTPNEEAQLLALSKEAIGEYMQARANSILAEWENKGIIKAASTISNIGKSKEEIRENLENFIWNDFYASNMILQLTIVDKAYYKNEDDIQKRLAELHSPGVRGNVYATDYHGNRVSDGTHRSVILTDFNKVRSNIIDNLTIIFDRKIEGAPEHLKLGYKSLKESIIAQFMEMNPVDGQAYNSPSSYRKKAFIFGKWSEKLEEAYKKIKDGTYTYNDLKVAFQILKPFLYGHAEKTREDGGLMSKIKVGMQYKNSEYLLILADAIMQNGDTGKPNLLRAIYDVMEESADKNPTKGIDTFQFESAVKTGAQNKVDLTTFEHMENGEKLAKEALEGAIYNEDGTYNLNTVNEIPFEYFALQQEIPMHYRDHEQIDGSQKRYTLCTDLETVYDGKEVLYKVGDEYLPAEKFRQVYEETYAENIRESLDKLALDLRLKGDKKARNIALSKLLLASITSRDGIEVISALTLDRNGNFKIPISEPVLYKRIEQLINSVIKNRVNKQEMPGGPLVQVSGVGLSEQLNIKFKDKNNGGLLMTKSEFEKSELYDKSKPLDDAFKEYLKKNQGGIAYYEALVSIQTMEIFSKFANKDGTIDLKAIEALNPNLLKLIGYRIPTEDKYSCLPIKIVGFLPKESGEGIMLPDEITTITDSDFDVDKMYIQRYELIISTKPRKKIFKTLLKTLKDSRIKQGLKPNTPILKEQLDMFLDNPEKMRFADDLMASLWDEYKKVAYVIKEPKKGRVYRNNKLIDMSYEVLTHESTVDKILTPGGFEALKKLGYGVEAYRTSGKSWEELQEMSPSELKDLNTSNKNIGFIDTQVHYYAQNAAASNVLGIFALNRMAHSILESKAYQVNIEKITKSSNPFIIGDTTFNGSMTLDPMRSVDGALISKTLGSGVAAAADAAKEPVLNLLNINSDTINVFITLIRLGTPLKTACLFMSQKVIKDAITEYNTANLEGYTSLNRIIEKKIKDTGFNDSSPINSEPFTEEEMIKGILETNDKNTYKTLSAFKKFLQISYAISMPTYVTRFNSISNAVGPLAVDNLIMEYKLIDFEDGTILDRNGNPLTPMDIIDDYPIISEFSKSLIYARDIFSGSATYSSTFNALIESLPKSLKNKITKNRELLSKLQDFYLSYILVASGVVDSKHCDYFINKFPKSFMASKMKEKYKDNPFIQAIQLSTDPKSKVPILKIETTGLDKQEKERLSAGWYDFHKAEPRMSFGLFNYCFFKGGATFNPKTFIGLLPNNVKSEIDLYLDTYTHPPTILADIAADQFIRNNCHNNKIVPIIRGLHLISHSDGYVEISDKEDVSTMLNIDVFKVGNKNSYTVFKKYDTIKEGENTTLLYKEIKPLGNSGEFLEISADNIEKSIRNSDFVVEEQDPPSVKEDPLDHKDPNINKTPTQDTTELLYSILMGSRDRETSRLWIEARKKDTVKDKKGMSMYFSNRLTQMGIDATPELLDKLLAEIGFC